MVLVQHDEGLEERHEEQEHLLRRVMHVEQEMLEEVVLHDVVREHLLVQELRVKELLEVAFHQLDVEQPLVLRQLPLHHDWRVQQLQQQADCRHPFRPCHLQELCRLSERVRICPPSLPFSTLFLVGWMQGDRLDQPNLEVVHAIPLEEVVGQEEVVVERLLPLMVVEHVGQVLHAEHLLELVLRDVLLEVVERGVVRVRDVVLHGEEVVLLEMAFLLLLVQVHHVPEHHEVAFHQVDATLLVMVVVLPLHHDLRVRRLQQPVGFLRPFRPYLPCHRRRISPW